MLAAPAGAHAADFVVAPGQSLVRAQLAARRSPGPDTITLRGGTYTLAAPLRLDRRDSNVVWRAAPGETPVLSGGVPVTGWTSTADGKWQAPSPVANTRELYDGGVRLTRARGGALAGAVMTATGFTTTDASLQRWRNPGDVELVFDVLWKQFRCGVAAIHGTVIEMREPCFANAQVQTCCGISTPTWVENAYELLDRPDEWYLDRPRRTLYAGHEPTAAVVPRLQSLVVARGVRNVAFDGITFAYTTWLAPSSDDGLVPFVDDFRFVGRQSGWLGQYDKLEKTRAAVTFSGSRGVAVTRCRFTHLAAAALAFESGSTDDRIGGNEFSDDGATAIELGDVFDHHSATPVRRITIEDNLIHDVAVEYQGGVGIWAGFVSDTTIAHNELRDLPYTAISVGWGWGKYDRPPTTAGRNTIAANLISNVVQVLGDGGGIYLNGAQPGTVVRGNVVHGNRNWGGALYLDDGSTGETVEDNVVWDTHQWPYMFKAADVTIRDNWWDFTSDWGWAFFQGGVVAGNHVIAGPQQAPAEILLEAGRKSG